MLFVSSQEINLLGNLWMQESLRCYSIALSLSVISSLIITYWWTGSWIWLQSCSRKCTRELMAWCSIVTWLTHYKTSDVPLNVIFPNTDFSHNPNFQNSNTPVLTSLVFRHMRRPPTGLVSAIVSVFLIPPSLCNPGFFAGQNWFEEWFQILCAVHRHILSIFSLFLFPSWWTQLPPNFSFSGRLESAQICWNMCRILLVVVVGVKKLDTAIQTANGFLAIWGQFRWLRVVTLCSARNAS